MTDCFNPIHQRQRRSVLVWGENVKTKLAQLDKSMFMPIDSGGHGIRWLFYLEYLTFIMTDIWYNFKVQEIVDEMTEPWGVEIERVEIKDVEIPPAMQRAMAKEAEAIREKRARLIKAAAEQEASINLAEASQRIMENPAALELRRLQMLTEIGAENNTTTLVMMPSDLITLAKQWTDALQKNDKVARSSFWV